VTLVVLLGGARSGKSRLAVEAGRKWRGDVTFVATAEARDTEMAQRIARHQCERPAGWTVVEEPLALAELDVLAPDQGELVIVDCLPLWLSNQLEARRPEDDVLARAAAIARLARRRAGPVLVVTNEVGLGVVPATPLGRAFRDLLGRVNQAFVAEADAALLVVAGRTLRLSPVELDELVP
jgi:adenosylcobinamide kinase / adenosylcobinamide-phosphate guanylyltransferase